jgi:regulator of sigma E protease
MGDFLGSVWWMIVSLGVLVTFHEFGHYWVARRCGVRVLRFSVGFGRPLWMRRGRDGTEYVVAALPLGGYVRMLDEREGDVAPDELGQAFNRQSVWNGRQPRALRCAAMGDVRRRPSGLRTGGRPR